MVMVDAKACTTCKTLKPLAGFVSRPRNPDGLETQCKDCINAKRREFRQRNLARERARTKSWHDENREHVRESNRSYRVRNRDTINARQRLAPDQLGEATRLRYQGLKRCPTCKMIKGFSDYNRNHDRPRSQCRACQSEAEKVRRLADLKTYGTKKRAQKYLRRFGLTLAQVEGRFAATKFQCEACGVHRDDTHNQSLVLDHDHGCCPTENTCGNCIRGVLCTKCNLALGVLGDDRQKVEKLLRYIKEAS